MPETDKKIAVAILNWNGAELLNRFLPNVLKHSQDLATVYVIDNASTDESLELLEKKFPEVKVIELPTNYGYAGGYNRGLEPIPEKYAVLLNSDVEVTEGWLTPLLQRFEENPELAALQPKIKDLNNRDYFEYAGAAGGFVDVLSYPFCRGRLFDTLEKDEGQYDSYREVFWASGACLMVDQDKYAKAGKLDESLFAHMEEIDLCWRMQMRGFKVACEPASTVYHLGGGTLNKLSPRKTYLNFRNSLIIMFLNLPQGEAMRKILQRMILDGVAGIQFMLKGKFSHLWAILRAHFYFYGHFNDLMRKKVGHKVLPLKDIQGVYGRSVVRDYFLGGKKKFSQLFK